MGLTAVLASVEKPTLRRRLSVPDAVTEVDFTAYTGRWYNVYYDKFTTIFSSPDCSTAYYESTTGTTPNITVNNSGTDGGEPTYLTGYAYQTSLDGDDGDLTLHLDGVSQDASYRIFALGEKTYGAGYYQYSVVTDTSGFSLYVLARDVDEFFTNYDDEVTSILEDAGYTGFFWGVSKNDQSNCPDSIYYPQWDSSSMKGQPAGQIA